MARGTASKPITMTSVLAKTNPELLPQRGLWGGLLIMGYAPIAPSGATNTVEGLDATVYGGNDPDDNSGVLSYVRVWYGGKDIVGAGGIENSGNEINGITLAGVGRGTTVDHCEVWSNA